MSLLSREIARWIQTNPGPIYAETGEGVYEKVRETFIKARRWKAPCPMMEFMTHLDSLGHRTTTRKNHETGQILFGLILPSRHIGS